MILIRAFVVSLACGALSASAVWADEHQVMKPRVPADKLVEARALASPLPDSAEVVEKGKTLYNGKGTCFNCHGKDGSGNGMAAVGLDPSPRNFQHHGFWRHRTEGEISAINSAMKRSGRSSSTSAVLPGTMATG